MQTFIPVVFRVSFKLFNECFHILRNISKVSIEIISDQAGVANMEHWLKVLVHLRNTVLDYKVNELPKGDTYVEWTLFISELPIFKLCTSISLQDFDLHTLWETALFIIPAKCSKGSWTSSCHT